MTFQAILLIGTILHARKAWSALQKPSVKLKEYSTGSREDFIQNCKRGEYDDVVAIFRSNASTTVTGRFDHELVDCLPRSLRYICHNGAGYDNIDVDACTARGILIANTPGAVNHATADVAIFLMIGALRQAWRPLSGIREGRWRGSFVLGHDPNKKVLGILGMGGIGREVALRAQAFGMKVYYHNRRRLAPKQELSIGSGVKYVSFEELLSKSDVLSLNLGLTKSTRNIIGTPEFNKMKDGVVIVNSARGELIDEEALLAALASGKVYSAGLDVYTNEPHPHFALLSHPGVFLLPHIGTATYETQKEMELLVLENVQLAISEGRLLTPIEEQAVSDKIVNGV